ncbi:MAG: IS3 family transposase [Clostridiales bacterium]|nr:IS3 family transposase [Clostridiales bacterium]
MSRAGNDNDNAIAENFFSLLKIECPYRQKIRLFQKNRERIHDFIRFCNHEKMYQGGISRKRNSPNQLGYVYVQASQTNKAHITVT